MNEPSHCPYRQATLLQQALSSDKTRVAFFVGAGCPTAIRIAEKDTTRPLIPAIAGLTTQVFDSLRGSDRFKTHFAGIADRLRLCGKTNPTIEDCLTHLRNLREVAAGGDIDGLSRADLDNLDTEICRLTTKIVNAMLPGDDTPYHKLATWIGGIYRSNPIEVFTTNYDLLMEQGLESLKVPYFDGFLGSHQTFFDLTAIEQDKLPSRWARLWKVHGSINWWRLPNGEVTRRLPGTDDDSGVQMIYPSHLKYDESRRLPYLAMLDRLKAFLANPQAVLITCGYSFADQHLNEVILQGLNGNPTAICFSLQYDKLAELKEATTRAKKRPNLSVLANDGAVLGSVEQFWQTAENLDHPLHHIAVKSNEEPSPDGAPNKRREFLLGDFDALGNFLAHQLIGNETKEPTNGP
jgi:hypothetical protein